MIEIVQGRNFGLWFYLWIINYNKKEINCIFPGDLGCGEHALNSETEDPHPGPEWREYYTGCSQWRGPRQTKTGFCHSCQGENTASPCEEIQDLAR